ncbi:MAG TPA: response regulator, partial [Nitrospiraceae bacterium]|nr:response regulator [Nitrospiraceae bacterium]
MTRILVVDDEEAIRELLDTVLRQRGHDVLLADSGRKALDVFRRERPQVTILDLSMPEMDGFAVLKQIRSVDPHARVIILTGMGTSTEEQRARELGVTDFLQKGFSLQALGAAMDRVLSYLSGSTESIPARSTDD